VSLHTARFIGSPTLGALQTLNVRSEVYFGPLLLRHIFHVIGIASFL